MSTLLTALHFVGQRYQEGRASYLDVLTSQRSLFDAELRLARTRQAQLVSVVQFSQALGEGWSVENQPGSHLMNPRLRNRNREGVRRAVALLAIQRQLGEVGGWKSWIVTYVEF